MNKIVILALASSTAIVLPKAALAVDKQLEKRLEALEAKMEHMATIEAENKELKVRLQKTEAKLERVTAQKVATLAPVRALERQATPVTVATPAIAKEAPVTPASTEKNWSGVYAGINAGYSTGEVVSKSSVVNTSISSSSGPGPQYIKGFGTSSVEGPVVGGQIGINYKLKNNIILGIETDFDYADINNRFGGGYANNNVTTVSGSFNQFSSSYARSGIDWLGTARLRLGYDLGNFMPYLTGGFAYGSVSSNSLSSMMAAQTSSGWDTRYTDILSGNNNSVQIGWATGAGAELAVAEHWSMRGEYLFTQLEAISTNSGGSSSFYSAYNGSYNSSNTGIKWNQSSLGPIGFHQVRVGLNYHTDWLKELPVSLR